MLFWDDSYSNYTNQCIVSFFKNKPCYEHHINGLERIGCISKKPCFKKIEFKKFLKILPSFIERQAIIIKNFQIKFIPAYSSS